MTKKDKSDVELEWEKERKQMESEYRMQSRQLHKKKSKFK